MANLPRPVDEEEEEGVEFQCIFNGRAFGVKFYERPGSLQCLMRDEIEKRLFLSEWIETPESSIIHSASLQQAFLSQRPVIGPHDDDLSLGYLTGFVFDPEDMDSGIRMTCEFLHYGRSSTLELQFALVQEREVVILDRRVRDHDARFSEMQRKMEVLQPFFHAMEHGLQARSLTNFEDAWSAARLSRPVRDPDPPIVIVHGGGSIPRAPMKPRAVKDPFGVVRLEGFVRRIDASVPGRHVLTLPEGYRPVDGFEGTAASVRKTHLVRIEQDGKLYLSAMEALSGFDLVMEQQKLDDPREDDYISLSGISFPTRLVLHGCFRSNMKVILADGTEKNMLEMRIGDEVLCRGLWKTAELTSSRVCYVDHFLLPEDTDPLCEIVVGSDGEEQSVVLTPDHLIPTIEHGVVPSNKVRVGDTVQLVRPTKPDRLEYAAVTRVSRLEGERHVSCVYTMRDTLCVGGIVCSCYHGKSLFWERVYNLEMKLAYWLFPKEWIESETYKSYHRWW